MSSHLTQTPNRPLEATGLILFAMALMGLVDNYVIVIADTAGLWQFQILRSSIGLLLLFVYAQARGHRIWPARLVPVAARSLVLSGALILYFASLAFLPISEAVAGLFTAPLFTAILSALVYRHRLGRLRLAAAVLGFLGVLAVLRPDTGHLSAVSLLPIAAGFLYSLAALATREWCAGERALTLVGGFFLAMGLWGVLGVFCLTALPQPETAGPAGFLVRRWGDMSGQAWIWTLAQALAASVAIVSITRAYQLAEASYVAVFEYALLVFAIIWAWLLFGQSIDLWAFGGIVAILASGAALASVNRRARAASDAPRRQADTASRAPKRA